MSDKIEPGQLYSIRDDGKWEIYLDATMCSSLALCPQYFKYSFIDSITPKGERPFARDLGTWWSEVMENVYGSWHLGNRMEGIEICKMAMKVWEDLNMDELAKYHPRAFAEFGGKYGAMAMIAEYVDRQLPIDYRTWKIIAAEASFGRNKEVCVGETDRVILYWMGQPDLFVISDNRVMPVDHKSIGAIDAKTAKKYKPNVQLPGYIIAGQILVKSLGYDLPIDRCVINCVARKDTTDKKGETKKPRFKRIFVTYTPNELEAWKRNRLDQAELLRTFIENDRFPWTEGACSYQWGHPCPFQNIDEKPPESRRLVMLADYVKRTPWIPGLKEKEEEK